jgi:hypothetical protein
MIILNNLYFRVKGEHIDFATPVAFFDNCVRFNCNYGNQDYKSCEYLWLESEFIKVWVVYTELNKALL